MSRRDFSGSRRALEHYDHMLALRPDSFWGHYRAAVVCFRLERWSEAADHLDRCRKRRPENSVLHAQFASCLRNLGRLDDALKECNRALERAPDHAEFFRTRAFIRAEQGQNQGLPSDLERFEELKGDLERFEMLTRFVSRTFFRIPPAQNLGDPRPANVPASHRALDIQYNRGFTAYPGDPLVDPDDLDPDDLDARAVLAASIRKAGAFAIAAREVDKILVLDPNHLGARSTHMMDELKQGHFPAARDDLDLILNHPDLIDHLRSDSRNFTFLYDSARQFALRGQATDASRIADRMLECSLELGESRGLSLYTKAAVLGVAARSDPGQLPLAGAHLKFSFGANSRYKEWYGRDKLFDPVRNRLDSVLEQLPAPPSRF